jgi:hypothetical protein
MLSTFSVCKLLIPEFSPVNPRQPVTVNFSSCVNAFTLVQLISARDRSCVSSSIPLPLKLPTQPLTSRCCIYVVAGGTHTV